MKRYGRWALGLTMALAAIGCGNQTAERQDSPGQAFVRAEGDNTIYGLACEGCNDTVLVFLLLPYEGTNPDTLNIMEASSQHRVYGLPRIGDKLAIMRSEEDTTKASLVIVTEDLTGKWCHRVFPTLRKQSGNLTDERLLPDTIKTLLATPREYSLTLKDNNEAFSSGSRWHDNEETPVEYPSEKRYSEWKIYNGQLLFTQSGIDTLGNSYAIGIDTADLVLLRRDTLVLRFADGEHGYYRSEDM